MHHFDSFIDITFEIHNSNQKVLKTLYVQFCEKIFNFERQYENWVFECAYKQDVLLLIKRKVVWTNPVLAHLLLWN